VSDYAYLSSFGLLSCNALSRCREARPALLWQRMGVLETGAISGANDCDRPYDEAPAWVVFVYLCLSVVALVTRNGALHDDGPVDGTPRGR